MSKKDELRKMGRRRFMKSLAALGVTGAALNSATRESLADVQYDPEHEVLRTSRFVHTNHEEVTQNSAFPERKPVHYTISREKWAKVEAANDAASQVREKIGEKFPNRSISVGVRMTTKDGHRKREVAVHPVEVIKANGVSETNAPTEGTLKSNLPSRVDGVAGRGTKYETEVSRIPVSFQESTMELEARGEYYNTKYPQIPGGAYCQTERESTRAGFGTIGTPCMQVGGYPAVITAGHVLYDRGGSTQNYNELHQPEQNRDNNLVGFLDEARIDSGWSFDAAVVSVSANRGVRYDLAEDNGGFKGRDINGTVTKQSLNDEIGSGSLTKQGSSTGMGVGTIREVTDHLVYVSGMDTEHGDSGGPYFKAYDDPSLGYKSASIAGVHRGTDSSNNGWRGATLMENIENHFDVSI